jgi:toxin ParE1/3/4
VSLQATYWLHPEAAEEHKKQVAYYEDAQAGLGRRYHDEFLTAVSIAADAPDRFAVVLMPDIRRTRLMVFHFDIIYREVNGLVQVLAVAHHRRQPGYWSSRAD